MISHCPIGQLVSSAFNVAERPHCTTIDNCSGARPEPRIGAQSHQTRPTATLRASRPSQITGYRGSIRIRHLTESSD
jgi:hypothetical protein